MLIQQSDSLDQAFTKVHDQLKRAGMDKNHKFRFFSVATVDTSKKTVPQSRMVVLRSFDDDWIFEFYTDHRASKVREIEMNPVISALFWDPSKRVQVRIEADAVIHNQDEVSAHRWKHVQGDAQKAYTSVVSPGSVIDSPEKAHQWPDSFKSNYFTVVVCEAVKIKALQLSGLEHLAFEYGRSSEKDEWKKSWIAP